jgi:2-polyprenyl-3-methyl-5-hydroxy-6-metoxy-1,4-benzoquinol methylase
MIACTICGSTRLRRLCRKKEAIYHLCLECCVIFQYPQPAPEAMVDYANTEYEQGVYRDYVEAREMKLEHFSHRLKQLLPRVRRGRLLDVGCSCGYFMQVAAASGFEVEGLEFSGAAIAAANSSVRPHIICSSIDAFDGNRSYDLVTAFDLIEHVPRPKNFLRKVRQLLVPGGWLAMSTPDAGHFLRCMMRSYWPMLQPMQHLTIFSRRGMRLALEEAGFGDIEFERATKTISYDYLADQLRALTPALHIGLRLLGRCLPSRTRRRYRQINIGEFMVLARPVSKQDQKL